MSAAGQQKAHVDEDVEDLDDVLEEFNAPPKQPAPAPTPSPAKPTSPPTTSAAPEPADADDLLSGDFAAEFARQMESVLRELGGPLAPEPAPAATGKDADAARDEAFRAAWEAMLVDEMDGLTDLSGVGKEKEKGATAGAEEPEDAFQRSVRQAMERLKVSEETLQADAAAGPGADFEQLLAQLGEGAEEDDALQGILEGMMGQLMGKDVLYEPLKELHDKFPGYLAEHEATLSVEDRTRYKAQQDCVTKIIAIFEDPSYSDADTVKGAQVVALVSDMQAHGTPPPEIMGPMPPGFELGSDGLPKMPDGCVIA
ncbi:Pex19-domain-containing protein [Artomyces pyxidatus]|uniref:Pex19-domain-containing protein n=1 Tax=Artomyces pyxidatus TaxID=48021 RepID=A0ACB8SJ09_9AGAM|nr:Pex19-domain-containing protein [Artomyces pyxidatus]